MSIHPLGQMAIRHTFHICFFRCFCLLINELFSAAGGESMSHQRRINSASSPLDILHITHTHTRSNIIQSKNVYASNRLKLLSYRGRGIHCNNTFVGIRKLYGICSRQICIWMANKHGRHNVHGRRAHRTHTHTWSHAVSSASMH